MSCQLFVYGTLMPSCGNYRQIEQYVHGSQPGSIRGILADLGAFPALVAGEGIVRGVVLEVDAEALRITDRIEGYSARHASNLYLRESVEVALEDGRRTIAWTYFFADPNRIAGRPTCLVGHTDNMPVYAWPPSH